MAATSTSSSATAPPAAQNTPPGGPAARWSGQPVHSWSRDEAPLTHSHRSSGEKAEPPVSPPTGGAGKRARGSGAVGHGSTWTCHGRVMDVSWGGVMDVSCRRPPPGLAMRRGGRRATRRERGQSRRSRPAAERRCARPLPRLLTPPAVTRGFPRRRCARPLLRRASERRGGRQTRRRCCTRAARLREADCQLGGMCHARPSRSQRKGLQRAGGIARHKDRAAGGARLRMGAGLFMLQVEGPRRRDAWPWSLVPGCVHVNM